VSARTDAGPRQLAGLAGLQAAVGQVLGLSPWLRVDRSRIDLFADATGDRGSVSTGPASSTVGLHPGTLAQEYLTMSLLPSFARQNYQVVGTRMALNYGLEAVRFPAPVSVDARIRVRTELVAVQEGAGSATARFRHTVEVETSTEPACVAEMLIRYVFEPDAPASSQVPG